MFKEGDFLNATSFHVAMAHHSKKGELEQVSRSIFLVQIFQMDAVFARIKARNVQPTPTSYAIRLEGYGRAGYLQASLKYCFPNFRLRNVEFSMRC